MGSSLSFISVEVNSLYYSEGESTRPYRAYLTSTNIPGIGKPFSIVTDGTTRYMPDHVPGATPLDSPGFTGP
jgi:hypothetical protein